MKMKKRLAWLLAALILTMALPALGEEIPTFDTLGDAGDFLRQQADQGATEAIFRVADRQSGVDLDHEALLIREMAGVYSVTTYISENQITAEMTCYPGSRIYHAAITGDTGALTPEEVDAMYIAWQAAQEAISAGGDDGYLVAKYLHDWLCAHVDYQAMPEVRPEMPRVCGAVGALVDGRANCQGYTDAFWLLGKLAGLQVRRQSGVSSGEDHSWNALCLEGEWYIMDVTHDDKEGSSAWGYAFMNIGRDLAGDYEWNEASNQVDIAANTRNDLWYFSREGLGFGSAAELAQYAYEARRDQGATVVYGAVAWQELDWAAVSDSLKAVADSGSVACAWHVWCDTLGGHSVYCILWEKWGD